MMINFPHDAVICKHCGGIVEYVPDDKYGAKIGCLTEGCPGHPDNLKNWFHAIIDAWEIYQAMEEWELSQAAGETEGKET